MEKIVEKVVWSECKGDKHKRGWYTLVGMHKFPLGNYVFCPSITLETAQALAAQLGVTCEEE